MSDDLVKRLRTEPNWMREDYPQSEAADRIEAQAARIAELEAALQDAARVLHKAGEQFSEYAKKHAAYRTAVGDLKAAANQQWAQRCFNAHDAALAGRER